MSVDENKFEVTVKSVVSGRRTLKFARPSAKALQSPEVVVQTVDDRIRLVADKGGLKMLRDAQRQWLGEQWRNQGLPGTVTFLHPFSGEMELTLDHESQKWGRHLKPRSEVTINIDNPIKAVVKSVQPWREKTVVRLVTNSGV